MEIEKTKKNRANILGGCIERLNNSSFSNKKWIYLITLIASNEKLEAKKIINKYVQNEDAFLTDVAKFCLTKIIN